MAKRNDGIDFLVRFRDESNAAYLERLRHGLSLVDAQFVITKRRSTGKPLTELEQDSLALALDALPVPAANLARGRDPIIHERVEDIFLKVGSRVIQSVEEVPTKEKPKRGRSTDQRRSPASTRPAAVVR